MELNEQQKAQLGLLIERLIRNTMYQHPFKEVYRYKIEELDAEIRVEVMAAIKNHYINHPNEEIRNIEAFVVHTWNWWKQNKKKHFKTKQYNGAKLTTPMSLDMSGGQAEDESIPQPFHTRIAGKDYVEDTSGQCGGYITRDNGISISATDRIISNANIASDNARHLDPKQPFNINQDIKNRFHLITGRIYSDKAIYGLRNAYEEKIKSKIISGQIYNPQWKKIFEKEEKQKKEEGEGKK